MMGIPTAADDTTAKLDLIARLLAHLVAAKYESLQEKALVLTSLGFSPKEIAHVCNTTPNTVSVRLAEAKRSKRKKSPAPSGNTQR